MTFVLDDSETTSVYAKDGAPARSRRSAAHAETPLHKAADAYVPKLKSSLQYAFLVTRKALTKKLVVPGHLESYADVVATFRAALEDVVAPKIHPMVVSGGTVAANMMRTAEAFRATKAFRAAKKTSTGTVSMEFDRKSQAAIDWADQHAGELIDGITETTREDISNAVAEYLETGDWDTYRDDVLDAIGNEDRADLIARHEPMVAVHEGQRLAWDQAVEEGLLTGDEQPIWIIVGDEKVCPICEGLADKTRELDGEYVGDDGESYPGPPAHVWCRCTEGLS